jgi:UDP:flavonoid glycosyltransferase YjiC (YdhE family)
MPTILFAWQLGGGMGHLMQMAPLVEGLSQRGHRVFLALNNLSGLPPAIARARPALLQAPFKHDKRVAFPNAASFAHLLANNGFGNDAELAALAGAWRNLLRMVNPDLIIFDHAPLALLAARGLPARRVLIGSGFCSPPEVSPLPLLPLLNAPSPDPAALAAEEGRILERANRLLAFWKQPPLQRLGQLYGEVDENFLVTFSELDHYGERPGVRYWGPVNARGGKAPQWPTPSPPARVSMTPPSVLGEGKKRIFAYLKPSPALPKLFQALRERGHPTLVVLDGNARALREKYVCDTLRFESERLDPALVAAQCDLAITNGNHGIACDLLLAGKPVLQFPRQQEQLMMASGVCCLDAGRMVVVREDFDRLGEILDEMLANKRYATAARAFAARHADFNPAKQRAEMLERACGLLAWQPVPGSLG